MLAPEGYGEIASSGQMITKKEVLLKKMNAQKIKPADQKWYIELFQSGPVPQSGFAMGLERLIRWICKLEHVGEASAFPRSFNSFYP